jgi:hypothetical protein
VSSKSRIPTQVRVGEWNHLDRAALGAVIVVAAGLCLYRLTFRSFWFDEIAAINNARLLRPGFLFPDGGNMVGYYLLLKGWLSLGEGEWTVRLLSVLLAAASAGTLYLLARSWFDRQVALIAAILLLASASFVRYGQEARGYVLELLLVIVAWLVLAEAVKRKSTKWFVLYGLIAGGAVAVHMFAGFFIAAQALSLLFFEKGQLPWRKAVIGLGVAGLSAMPIVVVAARKGSGQIAWIPPLSSRTTGRVFSFLIGMPRSSSNEKLFEALNSVFLVCGAAVWIGGLVVAFRTIARRGRGWEAWFYAAVMLWLLVPLALAFAVSATFQSLMVPRYFIALLPASALLLAVAISQVGEKVTRFLALTLLVILSSVGLVWTYQEGEIRWPDAVTYVMDEAVSGDTLSFVPHYEGQSFAYYAKRMQRLRPRGTASSGVAATAGSDAGGRRLWLVATQTIDIDGGGRIRSPDDIGARLGQLGSYRVVSTRAFGRVAVHLIEIRSRSS